MGIEAHYWLFFLFVCFKYWYKLFNAKARPSRAPNDVVPPGRDPVSSQRNSQFNGQFVSHTDLIELEVNSPVFFYTHRLDTQTCILAFP